MKPILPALALLALPLPSLAVSVTFREIQPGDLDEQSTLNDACHLSADFTTPNDGSDLQHAVAFQRDGWLVVFDYERHLHELSGTYRGSWSVSVFHNDHLALFAWTETPSPFIGYGEGAIYPDHSDFVVARVSLVGESHIQARTTECETVPEGGQLAWLVLGAVPTTLRRRR